VQFILQLKLCLYTTVHLLLEEFKISLESFLSTHICHTISPEVGVGVPQKYKDSAFLLMSADNQSPSWRSPAQTPGSEGLDDNYHQTFCTSLPHFTPVNKSEI